MPLAKWYWINILFVHNRDLHSEQHWALKSARRYGGSQSEWINRDSYGLLLGSSTDTLLHTGSVSHPLEHSSQGGIPAKFHRMESWRDASRWEQIMMNEASSQRGFHWEVCFWALTLSPGSLSSAIPQGPPRNGKNIQPEECFSFGNWLCGEVIMS